ncbi:hypothetical protein ASZ90_019597 [hydrocarbon metagenome]|uniref:Uncharacterized protein n=1 Tax=hydrocarbon metagenome TaxID=938273 RepID=A0A0W8E377_9ZZZZ
MPGSILQLDKDLNNNDLFIMWQNELSLRTSARAGTHDANTISIPGTPELEFWYRCWYFSDRKLDFFILLLDNLQNIQVLKWLGDGPVFLLQDFWSFLPWHIAFQQPNPEKLQFIVNLYNPEYHTAMLQVVNALNLGSCQYLLSRTANQELRKLFKDRESELLKNRKQSLYGFIKSQKGDSPGLYGDKIDNILGTLGLLEASSIHNYHDPYCAERFTRLLDAVEGVFRSGMVEDCLGMLIDLYEEYRRKNRLVSLLEDEKIHRTFYRLLRQVIPIYALSNQPLTPYELADRIYNEYFPLINRDPASLQYLVVYESIVSALNRQNPRIMYEIYMKSIILQKYRPFDNHLIESDELDKGIVPWRLEQFVDIIDQRISALPHESFILMEYLRMMSVMKLISLNDQIIGQLLDHYITLWQWLPCSLFMNETIYSQLAPLAGEEYRFRARAICDVVLGNNRNRLADDISSRPDLFRMKDAWLKRQVFAAHFLGGLK